MDRRTLAALIVVVLVAGFFLAAELGPVVSLLDVIPGNWYPSITVTPAIVAQGSTVTITGSGFAPKVTGQLTINYNWNSWLFPKFTTDSAGTFTYTVPVDNTWQAYYAPTNGNRFVSYMASFCLNFSSSQGCLNAASSNTVHGAVLRPGDPLPLATASGYDHISNIVGPNGERGGTGQIQLSLSTSNLAPGQLIQWTISNVGIGDTVQAFLEANGGHSQLAPMLCDCTATAHTITGTYLATTSSVTVTVASGAYVGTPEQSGPLSNTVSNYNLFADILGYCTVYPGTCRTVYFQVQDLNYFNSIQKPTVNLQVGTTASTTTTTNPVTSTATSTQTTTQTQPPTSPAINYYVSGTQVENGGNIGPLISPVVFKAVVQSGQVSSMQILLDQSLYAMSPTSSNSYQSQPIPVSGGHHVVQFQYSTASAGYAPTWVPALTVTGEPSSASAIFPLQIIIIAVVVAVCIGLYVWKRGDTD